ncbi:hypothetical protein D3C71_2015300 [compost metagenome]
MEGGNGNVQGGEKHGQKKCHKPDDPQKAGDIRPLVIILAGLEVAGEQSRCNQNKGGTVHHHGYLPFQ